MERRRGGATAWDGALRAAAWTSASLYGVTVVLVGDLEALAMGLGIVAGTWLLRFRGGGLGVLLLGVLFANGAAWMVPAAASNLRHGEGLFETLWPATIAVVSLVGLSSVVGHVLGRRRRLGRRGPKGAVVLGAVGLALVAAAAVLGVGTAQTARAGDLELRAERARFSETALEAMAGEVTVHMANEDLFWHTFTVPELGVSLNVPVKAERRVSFEAEPGTYAFICAVPGHLQAGMEGVLTVR